MKREIIIFFPEAVNQLIKLTREASPKALQRKDSERKKKLRQGRGEEELLLMAM